MRNAPTVVVVVDGVEDWAETMEYYKTNMDSDSMYYVGRRKGVVSEAATVPSSERGREERKEEVGEGSRYMKARKGCES
jgi:hypothetical protein